MIWLLVAIVTFWIVVKLSKRIQRANDDYHWNKFQRDLEDGIWPYGDVNSPFAADDERGAALIDYVLLVALVATVAIGTVTLLSRSEPAVETESFEISTTFKFYDEVNGRDLNCELTDENSAEGFDVVVRCYDGTTPSSCEGMTRGEVDLALFEDGYHFCDNVKGQS